MRIRGRLTLLAPIALLIALAVMVGWATHNLNLVALAPDFPLMVPITAELIFLLALALLLPTRASAAIGAGVVALATWLLIERILGFSVGLTALHPFDPAYVDLHTTGSRPATLTTACLLALGIAIVLRARAERFPRVLPWAGSGAALVLGIAWTLLVGYTTGVADRSEMWVTSGMALPTAAALLTLGLAVIGQAWRQAPPHQRARYARWWTVAGWLAVAGCVMAVLRRASMRPAGETVVPTLTFLLAASSATLLAWWLIGAERAQLTREALEASNASLRQREEELERSGDLLRAAREGALDAFMLMEAVRDPSGDITDFRFLDVNGRAEQLLARPREQIIGHQLLELFPLDQAIAYRDRCARVVETGLPLEEEFPVDAASLGVLARWVRQQVVRVQDGVAVTARDTSESRLVDDHLRHAQKMEAAGRLASGVAHDVNNLLTIVGGIAEVMTKEPELSASQARDLTEIAAAVVRGKDLTRRLLVFSRKQPTLPSIVDPNNVVNEVLVLARRALPDGTKLEISLAESLSLIVADRLLLEQGIMNLVLNARDAMQAGGVIAVRTSQLRLATPVLYSQGEIAAGDWVRIEVADQGSGLTPEAVEHLFEPFFTTKPPGKGTGLGLSATFSILREMDGHILLHSTSAAGTTFHIMVPVADPDRVRTAVLTPSQDASPGRIRIMVVDDEAQILAVVRRILMRAGFDVATASSADTGLPILASDGPFDILVTDMIMPGLSGREFATLARQRHPELRVVFMSGYTSDEAIRRGQLDVGEAFVQKPFTGDELLRTIGSMLT